MDKKLGDALLKVSCRASLITSRITRTSSRRKHTYSIDGFPSSKNTNVEQDEEELMDDLYKSNKMFVSQRIPIAELNTHELADLVKQSVGTPNRKRILRRIHYDRVNPSNVRMFLTEEQLQEFKDIFDVLDDDSSGEVTYRELKNGFKQMEVEMDDVQFKKMVIELDSDKSGKIDFDEFATLLFRVEMGLKSLPSRKKGKAGDQNRFSIINAQAAPFVLNKVNKELKRWTRATKYRALLWEFFDTPSSSVFAQVFSLFIMVIIVISCISFIVETIWDQSDAPPPAFDRIELMCVSVFTFEYFGRFISSPSPVKFFTDSMNVIDLIAIAPFYVEKAMASNGSGSSVIRVIRLVRIFRIFKIRRYLSWVKVFSNTFEESKRPLAMIVFVLTITLVFNSAVLFYAERGEWVEGQGYIAETLPGKIPFASIPISSWFVITTLVTVGYGDIVPTSSFGQLVGSVTAIFGILVLAVPISVISANFKVEYKKMLKQNAIRKSQQQQTAHQTNKQRRNTLESFRGHSASASSADTRFMSAHSAHSMVNHEQYMESLYSLIRANQKRMFLEMKDLELDNRVFLKQELIKISSEYVS